MLHLQPRNGLSQWIVWAGVFLLTLAPCARALAQESDEALDESTASPADAEEIRQGPAIAEELAKGIALLDTELQAQQQALHTAQTDRERELARRQLGVLKDEQRLLTHLLTLLVGPTFDMREAAREQQSELQDERTQKRLEQNTR